VEPSYPKSKEEEQLTPFFLKKTKREKKKPSSLGRWAV